MSKKKKLEPKPEVKEEAPKASSKRYPVKLTEEAYLSIKRMKHEKETMTAFISKMIKAAESLRDSREVYLVENHVFHDIREARGAAIMNSVTRNEPEKSPEIALIVDKDSLL